MSCAICKWKIGLDGNGHLQLGIFTRTKQVTERKWKHHNTWILLSHLTLKGDLLNRSNSLHINQRIRWVWYSSSPLLSLQNKPTKNCVQHHDQYLVQRQQMQQEQQQSMLPFNLSQTLILAVWSLYLAMLQNHILPDFRGSMKPRLTVYDLYAAVRINTLYCID